MQRSLDVMVVEGIKTNIPLHRRILDDPDFVAGRFDTSFMERFAPAEEDGRGLVSAGAARARPSRLTAGCRCCSCPWRSSRTRARRCRCAPTTSGTSGRPSIPLRLLQARELAAGRLPTWNPYVFEGTFLAPELYPLDLLHALWLLRRPSSPGC